MLSFWAQWRSSAVLESYWWRNSVSTYSVMSGILITSIAVLFFATLRDGHKWDGDESLYIMNARNIIQGRPYGDVGFIPNPRNFINPASYPPGLPLLLAPVYFFSGLDFQQMKRICVAAFMLFLVIFARIARRSLPPVVVLAVIALIGLNPFFFSHFKDVIRSEPPFLLFCYAALYLVDGLKYQNGSPRIWVIFVAGIALALAYLTRTIGVVLFPSILLISLYESRRLVNPGTLVLAVGISAIILMTFLFPGDPGAYVKTFDNYSIGAVLKRAFTYRTAINHLLFATSISQQTQTTPIFLFMLLLLLSILLLVLWGFIVRTRAHLSIFEVFTVIYALSMLIYPIDLEPSRYLAALCPMLLFYAFCGAYALGGSHSKTAQLTLPAILFGTFVTLYTINYANMDFGPVPSSITAPASYELFGSIKSDLPADAVLLTRKPTIIALLTDHRASIWPASFTDDELWRYMHDIKASYIVQDLPDFGLTVDQTDELNAFIDRNQAALSLIFSNRWFNMYRVNTAHPRDE